MKVYLVGGAVRDRLLSLPTQEHDWVVVGATPEDLIDQGYRQVGKDFPVFIHPKNGEEYALARTERKSGKGHQGFIVHSEPTITLEEDLSRRDLTINAIAEDSDGNLIDPYQGQKDLQKKILRHISPAFAEDPLRVLRVARFAAKFWILGFTIAPETLNLMSELSSGDELSYLSKERVWQETERALLTDNPEIFFLILWQVGALHFFTKSLAEALDYSENLLHLADVKKLDGLHARYIGLSMVAALNSDRVDNDIIKQFNQELHAPSLLQEFATLSAKYFYACTQALSLSNERVHDTLSGLDAFRRPDRCKEILICIEQTQFYFGLGAVDSIIFLRNIIPQLNQIKPDNDLKSLSGSEIGEVITQLRIEKIKELKP